MPMNNPIEQKSNGIEIPQQPQHKTATLDQRIGVFFPISKIFFFDFLN